MVKSSVVSSADASEATETSPLLGDSHHHGDGDETEADAGTSNGCHVHDDGIPIMAGRMHLFLPAAGIGMYLAAADQTLVLASYARIGSELNALNTVSWVITSYLLGTTGFQPLFGKLSDIFGRKECLLAAYSIFVLGSLGCGLANDMIQLCVSRTVTGIGAGGIMSVVSILVSDIVPIRDRGLWQSYTLMIFSAGMCTGAPLGGILADTLGWRWSFLAQVPACLLAMVAIYYVIELPPRPSQTEGRVLDKVRRIDFLGALFLILTVVSLLYGLDSGSNQGWGRLATIVPLSLLPVFLAAFIFVEARVAENPFIPGHVLFDGPLSVGFAVSFLNMAGQFPVFFFTPLFLQTVLDYSATTNGTLLIPGIIGSVTISYIGGLAIKRTGTFYAIAVICHGTLLLGVLASFPSIWFKNVVAQLASVSLAMGSAMAGVGALMVALFANASPEDNAVIVSTAFLFRALGSSVGISISSAAMQQTLRSQLVARLPNGDQAREIEEKIRRSLDYIHELPPNLAIEVRKSYQWAILGGLAPTLAFAILAFLLSLFIKGKRLNK